ncbi:MAG: exodeoxyribonuclease V subunit gamma, partial [Gemmatimonadaceae bacterium]|nr:exodeoxyribonuclease V subunit gamma [Gemmatimonadaceae bacterium]
DHSPRAPSIVLDELLDHCEARTVGARAAMVVQHPLQPFSPRYHDGRDPRLWRYETEATPIASPGAPPGATRSVNAVRTLSLTQLVTFWSHPAKWYCNEVLRFWLPSDLDVGSDDETLVLDQMEHGIARANLLQRALAGGAIAEDALRERMIAHGALGPGALGAAQLTAISAEVTEAIAGIDPAARRAPVEVRLHGAQWELSGSLDGIFGDVRYIVRGNSLAADRHIRALVEHLVMCAAAEQPGATVPTRTLIRYGKNGKRLELVLERVAGAMQVLEQWIDALAAATVAPPAFFPAAGIAWYETITSEKKGAGDPYAKALDAFEREGFKGADGDAFDPYVRTLFRDDVSLSTHRGEFERLASLLFSPFNTRAGARR